MNREGSKSAAVLVFFGSSYFLVGVLCNRWVLATLLSPDGVIENLFFNILIWVFDLAMVAWGIITIHYRNRNLIVNLNILILSVCVVSPIFGEMFIRTAIYLNVSSVKRPELYADQFADDDYWKLHHEWIKTEGLPSAGSIDPLLGWAPPKTRGNPLGIIADTPYAFDSHTQAALFYGDSFVEGVTPPGTEIPQQLDRMLAHCRVYNYGVGGYGVDQIYLRFKNSHPLFEKPGIIFGILTEDLYRSVLTIRTGPKPYFRIENATLLLQGVPVDSNPMEWLIRNPPQIKSYLLAFVVRKLRSLRGGDIDYKRTEIERINALIIKEVVREARENDLPLLFVVFYARWELHTSDWREVFLKEQLARWSVPYVDTKEILLRAARSDSMNVSEYYYPVNGHLNERGNRIIAENIAEHLTTGKLCVKGN